ncbi:hypothetical protein [Sinomicrobium weinanense]|uniref:Uncharacterized protein n=1 Tax=Sinomicrobium weinanense TaxID=2842200 RepID=A0A926JUM6_9FLAO|nr:hypothetical protein [Sinomicrobium weinanense]MBC9797852.1 hypothetical protein [Sinomicrobium weinanense]MBU3122248.1 hypothetical protein [Sinomicrobium weinanense]
MTKEYVKYAFTTAGVSQWQACLSGASLQSRNAEATLIEQGLYTYLPHRFKLNAEQAAYLDSLDSGMCRLWAAQLAYAVRHGIPVSLVKPACKGDMNAMNTKFIVAEGNSGNEPGQPGLAAGGESGYFLRFTINY